MTFLKILHDALVMHRVGKVIHSLNPSNSHNILVALSLNLSFVSVFGGFLVNLIKTIFFYNV